MIHTARSWIITSSLLFVIWPECGWAASFRISGVVVDSVKGSPVAGAHLEASLSTPSARPRGPRARQAPSASADADETGHFSLQLSSAGSWRLTASAAGYVRQAYEQHGEYSSAVVLTASSPAYSVNFRIAPQSRIAGTILDEAGEGVRGATVELVTQPVPVPGAKEPGSGGTPFGAGRRITQTDDRGMYEFAGLMPGSYLVRVQARPWYASSPRGQNTSAQGGASSPSTASEPDLDVAYAAVWYPGVLEREQATPLILDPGDQQQADLQLSPIPSLHLRVLLPRMTEQSGARVMQGFPVVERIDSNDAGQRFVPAIGAGGGQGQVDVGGLTPGVYRVTLPGRDGNTAIVRLAEGGSSTVDLRESQPGLNTVRIKTEAEADSPVAVELVDATTGQRFGARGPGAMGMRGGQDLEGRSAEQSIKVPDGRYEVVARSRDLYLTGLAVTAGGQVAGRYLTVNGGSVITLALRMTSGRSNVTGFVTSSGKPSPGIFVMLVPAGLDDPGSFTTLERDQTDTDGSFHLENVIPGQYLLVAVEHGWEINWSDPSTLRRYLLQAVPLEVRGDLALKQNIEAQAP